MVSLQYYMGEFDHFQGRNQKGGRDPLRVVMKRKPIIVEEFPTTIFAGAWPGKCRWLCGIRWGYVLLTLDENAHVLCAVSPNRFARKSHTRYPRESTNTWPFLHHISPKV